MLTRFDDEAIKIYPLSLAVVDEHLLLASINTLFVGCNVIRYVWNFNRYNLTYYYLPEYSELVNVDIEFTFSVGCSRLVGPVGWSSVPARRGMSLISLTATSLCLAAHHPAMCNQYWIILYFMSFFNWSEYPHCCFSVRVTLRSWWMTDLTMGTINAAVAVLDIHMDRNIVVSMIPSSSLQSSIG